MPRLYPGGSGLRAGELCGLRREWVQLRERRLEVVTVRYDAGRFGRGYKHRPKSTAGIRVVPLAGAVAEVLARCLRGDRRSLLLPEATRYVLRHGYLRAVRQATRHGNFGSAWTWTCAARTTCDTPSRPGWKTTASRPG